MEQPIYIMNSGHSELTWGKEYSSGGIYASNPLIKTQITARSPSSRSGVSDVRKGLLPVPVGKIRVALVHQYDHVPNDAVLRDDRLPSHSRLPVRRRPARSRQQRSPYARLSAAHPVYVGHQVLRDHTVGLPVEQHTGGILKVSVVTNVLHLRYISCCKYTI